jgi:hypothetical protein
MIFTVGAILILTWRRILCHLREFFVILFSIFVNSKDGPTRNCFKTASGFKIQKYVL